MDADVEEVRALLKADDRARATYAAEAERIAGSLGRLLVGRWLTTSRGYQVEVVSVIGGKGGLSIGCRRVLNGGRLSSVMQPLYRRSLESTLVSLKPRQE